MATYEQLKLKDYRFWVLFLHRNQYYLGRSYAWLKRPGEMQRLSELNHAERNELFDAVLPQFESATASLWRPDHMNYAWLGNHIETHGGHGHLHIIPRYSRAVHLEGLELTDNRWGRNYAPTPVDLSIKDSDLLAIRNTLATRINDERNCPGQAGIGSENKCDCGSKPQEQVVRNVNPVTRLGEVWCTKCGGFVRIWDPT